MYATNPQPLPEPAGTPRQGPSPAELKSRSLGLTSATGLVIGSISGTGVFTMPAVLAAAGTSSLLVLAVVAVGAMLLAVLFGQLTNRVPNSDGGLFASAAFHASVSDTAVWISASIAATPPTGTRAIRAPDLSMPLRLVAITRVAEHRPEVSGFIEPAWTRGRLAVSRADSASSAPQAGERLRDARDSTRWSARRCA